VSLGISATRSRGKYTSPVLFNIAEYVGFRRYDIGRQSDEPVNSESQTAGSRLSAEFIQL
jgi:hypothetical protein